MCSLERLLHLLKIQEITFANIIVSDDGSEAEINLCLRQTSKATASLRGDKVAPLKQGCFNRSKYISKIKIILGNINSHKGLIGEALPVGYNDSKGN